jgi:hypothetical protein
VARHLTWIRFSKGLRRFESCHLDHKKDERELKTSETIRQSTTKEFDILLSALHWIIEKLHRRYNESTRDKAYLEALDLLRELRQKIGGDPLHYYVSYND